MDVRRGLVVTAGVALLLSCRSGPVTSVTVPVTLDHNRMLVSAEIQRKDGTWRTARLWIDTGNPDFLLSEELAADLGIEPPPAGGETPRVRPVAPPSGVRIGGLPLDFTGVTSKVMAQPKWLFTTMHNDGNLPSTVLQRFQVVFDFPRRRLTLAAPGSLAHRGVRVPASVNPATGIVQVDTVIGGQSVGLAIDLGASWTFVSEDVVAGLAAGHSEWPQAKGAVGCANIWGWWPQEEAWPLLRVPEVRLGEASLAQVGIVGLPSFFGDGASLGTWYSKKSARPVDGFLGPNALRGWRVEIDYAGGAVYLEKGAEDDAHDMDLVPLTLRPQPDGGYTVLGGAAADGVQPGDTLVAIGDLAAKGATMGTVVDALRGAPGEVRRLTVERGGTRLGVEAKVTRHL
jgi:hypothetical protein